MVAISLHAAIADLSEYFLNALDEHLADIPASPSPPELVKTCCSSAARCQSFISTVWSQNSRKARIKSQTSFRITCVNYVTFARPLHGYTLSPSVSLSLSPPTRPPPLRAPALYPNLEELGDYMGLALNSDEVQRNLALVPVADNVSTSVCV